MNISEISLKYFKLEIQKQAISLASSISLFVFNPNAPKRNMSAYLLYQNCMRETFKVGLTFLHCG